MNEVIPVILSGGAGTRLWPLSRESEPKQFQSILGATTMLQDTLRRARVVSPDVAPMVVCNAAHGYVVAGQARAVGAALGALVLEPAGRNTAAAIATAALVALQATSGTNPPLLLVMPADHVIRDDVSFESAVRAATVLARLDKLVTFGIVPTRAETGYGYIRAGAGIPNSAGRTIDTFVEKPDEATAREYLAAGTYYWNSGMFLVSARLAVSELRRHEPALVRACEEALGAARRDGQTISLDADAFARARAVSFDHAVMERTVNAAVVPLSAGWSDMGAWDAVWEQALPDSQQNVVVGDVHLEDASGCYVRAADKLVAVVGLEDVVVVDTRDALLVAARCRSQDVKHVVAALRSSGRREVATPSVVARPWGTFQSVTEGAGHQVKRIVVRPGQKLSLQRHRARAEHWVVVAGMAIVTVDERRFELRVNEHVFVPQGSVHRLENEGESDLVLIEVQVGSYLAEDDIERLDDMYGRSC
jgi:mannose-1-phosphate guanylyltransferase/mannose-6-phosphate isomerase